MLAVQEANFLYSFTLSAFTAMSTTLTMFNEGVILYSWQMRVMLGISLLYTLVGISLSVYMYGRKNIKLIRQYNEEISLNNFIHSQFK